MCRLSIEAKHFEDGKQKSSAAPARRFKPSKVWSLSRYIRRYIITNKTCSFVLVKSIVVLSLILCTRVGFDFGIFRFLPEHSIFFLEQTHRDSKCGLRVSRPLSLGTERSLQNFLFQTHEPFSESLVCLHHYAYP